MAQDEFRIFQMPSNVAGQVLIYNNVYVLCENSINKVQTGAMIDIYNEYEQVPSTNILISTNGANNKIIVNIWRIMERIGKFELEVKNAKNIKMREYCCNINSRLLAIIIDISNLVNNYEAFIKVYNEMFVKSQIKTVEKIITDHPNIPNLENLIKNIIVDNIGGIVNKLSQLIVDLYILDLSETQKDNIMKKDKNI